MEAKLAAMAKRKPADEDYIPGQGSYRRSDTASPLPEGVEDDVEMNGEDAIGLEEGQKGADTLESEMEAELWGGCPRMEYGNLGQTSRGTDGTKDSSGGTGLEPGVPPSSRFSKATAGTLRPPPTPTTSLPPRPVIPTTAELMPSEDPKAKAREEALKRGLAGLPKKPIF